MLAADSQSEWIERAERESRRRDLDCHSASKVLADRVPADRRTALSRLQVDKVDVSGDTATARVKLPGDPPAYLPIVQLRRTSGSWTVVYHEFLPSG